MNKGLLWWLVVILVAWFIYTHFIRKVPFKG